MAVSLTETDVLNAALSKIGATTIVAINDGSTNANHCKRIYPQLRRALLRMHHWNFAETRASLASDPTPPAFEFAFRYALPPNLLKIKEYNGTAVDTQQFIEGFFIVNRFKIEGRYLLTNDGEVKIVFVQDVEDPNQWDALFYQTMVIFLASDLADAVPHDAAKAKNLLDRGANFWLPVAAANDGQEGSVHPIRSDDLIRGR